MLAVRLILIGVLASHVLSPAAIQAAPAETEIRSALAQWTDDFNAGRADVVCDLFAPGLRADVRNARERDFETQCALLRKALADAERAYTYAFDIKEILAEGDMAVVRLTWTATARVRTTGHVSTTGDDGLDVFARGSDGRWRIIRYMAYERP